MKYSIFHSRRYLKFAVVTTPFLLLAAFWGYHSLTKDASSSEQPALSNPQSEMAFAKNPSWVQDFSDQQDETLDAAKWNIATPALPIYNHEEQIYTDRPENVRIEAGALVLQAKQESFADKQFTSGRIDTKGKQSFRYGKILVTMRLPKGSGTWPAAWLLSASEKYTKRLFPTEKDWAEPRFYMNDGELDIIEYAGANPRQVESSFHTYDKSYSKTTDIPGQTYDYHTYGMLWTPDKITYTVDGKAYHELKKTSDDSRKWPFDQPMYLILNLAMGGKMGGTIDTNTHQSWQLAVKKIAYYPYTGEAAVP